MTQPHEIDTELLTMLGDLPATPPTEEELCRGVVDFLFEMAAEPRPGSLEALVLAAYVAGGETAAVEEIARLPGIEDSRIRDALLRHAADTMSARRLIEQAQAR